MLGVVIGLFFAVDEADGKEYTRQITSEMIESYIVAMASIGLIVAAVVAVIVAIEKRDAWFNHL